jgi:NTE family protein
MRPQMTNETCLVLGGGGVAGIAWMTGLLAGLADAGNDVTGAAALIGTSAGSSVAAQIGSGLSLNELFARQTEPALQAPEIPASVDLATFGAALRGVLEGTTGIQDMLRRLGAFALEARTVPEAARRAVIAARLPSHEWPARRLQIVAVDASTGVHRVFDRGSGVPLVDAVTASCAVPGVWPPATIDGVRYIDGGVRSSDNADLASGFARIIVVSPIGPAAALPSPYPLRDAVAQLRAEGSEVIVLTPDADSVAAMGTNPLDPATRTPAAHAGRAQGRARPPSAI